MRKRPGSFRPERREGYGFPWETVLLGPGTLNANDTVRLATAAALAACTYDNTPNGGTGEGATITLDATGTLTIDGVLVALNNRVLIKNQVAGAQNGVYLCTTAGGTGVAAVLTRATDSDTTGKYVGQVYGVTEGTANARTFWKCSNASAPTVGTTSITFAAFYGLDQYRVPAGLVTAPLSEISPEGAAIEVTDALFVLGTTGVEGSGGPTVTDVTVKLYRNGTAEVVGVGTIASIVGGVTLGHDEADLRNAGGEGVYLSPGDWLSVIVTGVPNGTSPTAPTNLNCKLRGYSQGAK